MGYLRPTAIIVTGTYGDHAERAHAKAIEVFAQYGFADLVTALTPEAINGTRSFLVAWDGSKEGWDQSDQGDAARAEYVAWLRGEAYEDHSNPLDWVQLQYGGDDRLVLALAHDGEYLEVGAP